MRKYHIKIICFVANNFIFKLIHSYFAAIIKYNKSYYTKRYEIIFYFHHCPDSCLSRLLCGCHRAGPLWKKGNSKPEEEVFDLGAPEDEQSVSVTESDTGFNVGNEKYETDVAPTASPAPQETETADNNGEIAVAEKLKRLKAQAEEQMEETETYLSDAYTADELYKAMLAKGKTGNRPELVWKPLKDRL